MTLKQIGSNQNQVTIGKAAILFSYNTPVAACVDGAYFRTDKKWSVTTSKHINAWIGGSKAQTKPQAWFDTLANPTTV